MAKGFLSFVPMSNRLSLGCKAGPHHRNDEELRDAVRPSNRNNFSNQPLGGHLAVPQRHGALFEVLPPSDWGADSLISNLRHPFRIITVGGTTKTYMCSD